MSSRITYRGISGMILAAGGVLLWGIAPSSNMGIYLLVGTALAVGGACLLLWESLRKPSR